MSDFNKAEMQKISKKMYWTVHHLLTPAFKYWVNEHGLSMTTVDEFVQQLFTEDSNVQVLNASFISMGPMPMKTIVFDLGYYQKGKLVHVITAQLIMKLVPKE